MSIVETPEERWYGHKKAFHLTGEVSRSRFLSSLREFDAHELTKTIDIFECLAASLLCELSVLAVGSAADLSNPSGIEAYYSDIDLLLCSTPVERRLDLGARIRDTFIGDNNYHIEVRSKTGSTHNEKSAYFLPFKVILVPGMGDLTSMRANLDVTFAGTHGGEWEEILNFHRVNNLAFAIL